MVSNQKHLAGPAAALFDFLTLLSSGQFQDSRQRELMINAAIAKATDLIEELRGHLKDAQGDDPTVPQLRYREPYAEAMDCGRAFDTGLGSRG
jgi:hypothetical protein